MRMEFTSPRTTAPGHTEAFSPNVTSPMMVARGCTQAPEASSGYMPMNGLMAESMSDKGLKVAELA
jgi:hypothetical protein